MKSTTDSQEGKTSVPETKEEESMKDKVGSSLNENSQPNKPGVINAREMGGVCYCSHKILESRKCLSILGL